MNEPSAGLSTNAWDRFWFVPESGQPIARLRGLLCLLTAIFFVSSWSDVAFWYGVDGPLSAENQARFWRVAGLQQEARWNLSPLFLTDRPIVYQLYLLIGVALCIAVAAGRGGRAAAFLLWAMLVGWANRSMMLSGLVESLLSLSLFASAIAPAAPAWVDDRSSYHWTARLARQLIAVETSLIAAATFATMLGGRVWFNGLGAYALAAPWQDRTINWTNTDSLLVSPSVHELLTHFLVLALPVGLLLAWLPSANRYGKAVLFVWAVSIAALGSLWLYAATFAVMVSAIRPGNGQPSKPGG